VSFTGDFVAYGCWTIDQFGVVSETEFGFVQFLFNPFVNKVMFQLVCIGKYLNSNQFGWLIVI